MCVYSPVQRVAVMRLRNGSAPAIIHEEEAEGETAEEEEEEEEPAATAGFPPLSSLLGLIWAFKLRVKTSNRMPL